MRDRDIRLTPAAERQMEENFANEAEAWKLLALIDAEFQSDPMSVQCFDLRIVQRVKECVAARRHFNKTSPFHFSTDDDI